MFRNLRREVHISWIIAVICVGITSGVILAQYIDYRWFESTSWLLFGAVCLLLCAWKRIIIMIACALVAGFVIGLWRGSALGGEVAVYDSLIGSTAVVRGMVQDDADLNETGELVLRIKVSAIDDNPVKGIVWVAVDTRKVIQRSDIVTVRGKLSDGFGAFNAAMFKTDLLKVQRQQPSDIALHVRDWLADAIRTVIPEPEASLGIGYLVGQRRALPPELDAALQVAGLTHIVVASGYNLTILIRLARRLLEKKSKYLAALAGTSLIVSFIAITGLSPSMSRAGLVAGLSLAAWYYGRKFHPLVLLPVAAAVTLLINPSYGWSDLGWQLSFAAFAGVMILAPLGQRYFFGDKKPGIIRQILGETVAAQAATLPIIVCAFGTLSNVAVIANLLVLPLVPLAMLLVAVAGFGSIVSPFLAPLIALPATGVLVYMVWIIQYVAGLPWAQTNISIGLGVVLFYYIILVVACIWMWRSTRFNLRDTNIVE